MKYILFAILLTTSGEGSLDRIGTYDTYAECFEERELYVKKKNRPIQNYQAICVIYNPK